MTGPVDDVLEQIVEDYLARRTSYVRDRAYSLAYSVHYDVTVQVDATAGDPEVLIEQKGIIPVAMSSGYPGCPPLNRRRRRRPSLGRWHRRRAARRAAPERRRDGLRNAA